jgi:hypothetical protein
MNVTSWAQIGYDEEGLFYMILKLHRMKKYMVNVLNIFCSWHQQSDASQLVLTYSGTTS